MNFNEIDDGELSPAARLEGVDLDSGWHLQSRMERLDGQTGSTFSVGYLAINGDGKIAFLKALDFSRALEEEDLFAALEKAIDEYQFEETLLCLCADRRMSKVVRTLDSGFIKIDNSSLGRVPYILFEPAEGDLRKAIISYDNINLAWAVSLLHETAVGLQQLHFAQIAHQDLKPSNILTFHGAKTFKISDLGCASRKGYASPRDTQRVAGGWSVTAPELQYGELNEDWLIRRVACDLYSLGSLAVFLFCGASMNAIVRKFIPTGKDAVSWRGTYREVFPFIRNAYDETFASIEECFEGGQGEAIFTIVRELCEPDPHLRGNPGCKSTWDRYAVQKYVSRLGNIKMRAVYASKIVLKR